MPQPISLLASLSSLHRMLMLDRRDISVSFAFGLLAGLVHLSLPLGIQSIINFVMANQISTSIVVLIGMVVFGVFINGLLQVKQLQIIEKVKQKLFVRYSLEYGDRLPKLNIEKLDHEYLPEMVNRFFDSISLQKSLDKLLIDIPAAIIQVILGLMLLAFYHPVFIVFGLVLILIVFTIIRFTSLQGFHTALTASTYKYSIAAWLQEIARTIKSFRYSKDTSLHLQKTDTLTGQYLESRTNHFKVLLTQFWSLISFKVVITAAMLIIGTYLLINEQINVGQFIAADLVILFIIASIERLITNIDSIYDAIVSVKKLSLVTDAETEESGSMPLADKNEGVSIQFQDVNFSYVDDKPVLKNLQATIAPNELVLITGISGAGKSTVLRLLSGAFKRFTGEVLIDNIPIGNYQVSSLRKWTGILLGSQDIFQDTIWNNLTMGHSLIQLEQVNRICQLTGLDEFVKSCKDGYDTLIMPVGNKLSRRVRKNILLARALLGNHRLMLLEEPVAHLPTERKTAVLQYLKNETNATVLITSQDESLQTICDRIIQLNANGEIIELPTANV